MDLPINLLVELRRLNTEQSHELNDRLTFANMLKSRIKHKAITKGKAMEILSITEVRYLKDYTTGFKRMNNEQIEKIMLNKYR